MTTWSPTARFVVIGIPPADTRGHERMKVPVPHFLATIFDAFGDWANVPIWQRGRLEVRRIDVILVLAGIFCVSWYGYTGGWQGALAGGAMYVLVAMTALWVL